MRLSDSIPRRPTLAFGLSLAAGAIILLGGFLLGSHGTTSGLALLGVISGAVVLIGAISLMVTPRRHSVAGLFILVASAIALGAYGWLVLAGVGVALGIAAGILAIEWDPRGPTALAAIPK